MSAQTSSLSSGHQMVAPTRQLSKSTSGTFNSTGVAVNSRNLDLVEQKFEELAKKIFDELRQAKYSSEFFQAVDCILSEPIESNFKHNANRAAHFKQQTLAAAANSDKKSTSPSLSPIGGNNYHQRRHDEAKRLHSSPVSAATPSQVSIQSRKDGNDRVARGTTTEADSVRNQRRQQEQQKAQKSAIPMSTVLNGISGSQLGNTPAGASSKFPFPICKSATTGLAEVAAPLGSVQLKRQVSLRDTSSRQQSSEQQLTTGGAVTRTSAFSGKLSNNRSHTTTSIDNDEDLEDADDDDDDDEDDDEEEEFGAQNLALRRAYLNQRFINQQQLQNEPTIISSYNNQLSNKSKTLSDGKAKVEATVGAQATHCDEANVTSAAKSAAVARMKASASEVQQAAAAAKARERFNPIARSSTIGDSSQMARERDRERHCSSTGLSAATTAATVGGGSRREGVMLEEEPREPRSIGTLTGRDIAGHLYKPHMNYSTSVLGNHRLSDDDEIIIIPTQSPSLFSQHSSPDTNECNENVEELGERFSISRTKSFWEKLSKSRCNTGKRGARFSTSGGGVGGGQQQQESVAQGQGNDLSSRQAKQQIRSLESAPNPNRAGGRAGVRTTSVGGDSSGRQQSNSLSYDRMDSTGGSYSNYSCSSSGDENNTSTSLNADQRRLTGTNAAMQQAHHHNSINNNHNHQMRLTQTRSNNPKINQLQDEMSRENRLRQTR